MRDRVRFEAPLGALGRLASASFVGPHLERFLSARNSAIKEIAESEDGWRRYAGA
jgi:hypothetical protein